LEGSGRGRNGVLCWQFTAGLRKPWKISVNIAGVPSVTYDNDAAEHIEEAIGAWFIKRWVAIPLRIVTYFNKVTEI
jgi:hypothetical protein